MWGLRKVGDEMVEERRKLKELVVEQMEIGLLVEVMAVDGNKPLPSVVFHQLFGDFILNFKLLAQGIVEVDPLDVNDLDLKMNGKAAGRKAAASRDEASRDEVNRVPPSRSSSRGPS